MKKRTAQRFQQTLPPSIQAASDEKVRLTVFNFLPQRLEPAKQNLKLEKHTK